MSAASDSLIVHWKVVFNILKRFCVQSFNCF